MSTRLIRATCALALLAAVGCESDADIGEPEDSVAVDPDATAPQPATTTAGATMPPVTTGPGDSPPLSTLPQTTTTEAITVVAGTATVPVSIDDPMTALFASCDGGDLAACDELVSQHLPTRPPRQLLHPAAAKRVDPR